MSLHSPVIFSCPVKGDENGRFLAYMPTKMTMKSRDLVEEFLAWAKNSEWRIEEVSMRERRDRNVPQGSRVVSFPVHQKGWFYKAYETYIAPVRAFMARNGYTEMPVFIVAPT